MRCIDAEKMIADTKAMKIIAEGIEIDGIIKYLEENSFDVDVFPCKVGDTVYQVEFPTTANITEYRKQNPIIIDHVVSGVARNSRGIRIETTYVSSYGYDSNAWFYWEDGYLLKTYEEAEKRVKKWKEKEGLE